jgi:hypothetical protein
MKSSIENSIRPAIFLVTLFLLIILTFLPSCNECPQDDGSTNIFDSGLFFELRDKTTDENLLNLFFGEYNQDTVKILKQDLTKESSVTIDPSGLVWFRCLENPADLAGLNSKVTKTFFLYLNRFDTDTIRIEFTLKKSDCPSPDFKEVSIFFNNKINSSGPSTNSPVRLPYQIFKK